MASDMPLDDYMGTVKRDADAPGYLKFTIFYAPTGIAMPEGGYEPGWYVQIDDAGATGDPMGPEPTPHDAMMLAVSEGWVADTAQVTADEPWAWY